MKISDPNDDSLRSHLAKADRAIQREQLAQKIRGLGGFVPEARSDDVSETELSFLRHVIAWEEGSFTTHRQWLARRGLVFPPPTAIGEHQLPAELWRLIEALAVARVFLYHTNHLSDADLYAQLWTDVLNGDAPDFARTEDDGCHWDLACPGSGEEAIWLAYYATERERRDWARDCPDTALPPRQRARFQRDHRLPAREH